MAETSAQPSVRLGGSNATITSGEGLVAFSFPRGEGVLRPARWQFRDRDDLVEVLAGTLSLPVQDGGLRGTVRRHGKYVRRNADGEVLTTFGDPILDLITNEHGELMIGGQRLSIGSAELREAKNRMGGVGTIDLALYGEEMIRHNVARAAMGEGDFVLTECTDRVITLASVLARRIHRDGDTMQFKAWKKSGFYWSMGAEIETWGEDFQEARIESRYLDTVVAQTCAAVKFDSDDDTDDDYLDEYEWGINAPQPLRVISLCTARWKGENFGPSQVEAGADCFEVEF
jgi:hypothetical protein